MKAMKQDGEQAWPDLAGRALGGSVIYANDELFAERENLIKPEDPVFPAAHVRPQGPAARTAAGRPAGGGWPAAGRGGPAGGGTDQPGQPAAGRPGALQAPLSI